VSTTFDVHVRDTTGPAIQVHANLVIEATGSTGATVAYTLPTATDAVNGAATVTCAPLSGTTFAIGHTPVTCTSHDATGNTSTSSFDVHVLDTTAPTIQAHANLVIEATGPTGATGTYSVPTATDTVSGATTVTCAPSSGSTFALGHTTVTCTSHDAAGNAATGTFDVHVRDTTAPVITVPADFSLQASSSSGIVATFATSATDVVDGTDPVTCSPASGTTFAVGHTVVSCTAHDAAGNTSSASLNVFVSTSQTIYDGAISMLGVLNTLNGLQLSQSVYSDLRSQLITAGMSWISGDAVGACAAFDVFAASTQAQLSVGQYSQVGPSITATRQTLGC